MCSSLLSVFQTLQVRTCSFIESVALITISQFNCGAVLVSLGLSTGGTEVTVEESGGVQPLLTVTIQGTSVSDIPISITPLTYSEVGMELSTGLLEQLYPARPIRAATGSHHSIVCLQLLSWMHYPEKDFNSSVLFLLNTGSITLPATLDDSEVEFSEGYILFLQVDVNGLHPSDARRIGFLNRYILVTIRDDDSKTKSQSPLLSISSYHNSTSSRLIFNLLYYRNSWHTSEVEWTNL